MIKRITELAVKEGLDGSALVFEQADVLKNLRYGQYELMAYTYYVADSKRICYVLLIEQDFYGGDRISCENRAK